MKNKITPFLWFDNNLEEAVKFYPSISSSRTRRCSRERTDEAGLRSRLNNLVMVTFAAPGKKTQLTLHHAAFQTVADCDDHQGGWTESLDRLAGWAARGGAP